MLDDLRAIISAKVGAIDPTITPLELAEGIWLAQEYQRFHDDGRQPPASSRTSGSASAEECQQIDSSPALPHPSDGQANHRTASVYLKNTTGQTTSKHQGVRLHVRGSAALRQTRHLARALRTLKYRIPDPERSVVDVEATIQSIVDLRLGQPRLRRLPWWPQVRPDTRAGFNLIIVVDEAPSTRPWQAMLREFVALVRRVRAFERVYVLGLDTLDAKEITLWSHLRWPTSMRRRVKLQEITSERQRTLALVISDCITPAWRSGTIGATLQSWATTMLVTIVQLFPQRYWADTALGTAMDVVCHPGLPIAHNRALIATARDPWDEIPADAVIFPVVTMTAPAISRWANLVMGRPSIGVEGIALRSHSLAPVSHTDAVLPQPSIDAAAQVTYFLESATPAAGRLACVLAVLRAFTLPLVRMLQSEVLHESGMHLFAEVLVSGLLREIPDEEGNPEASTYTFMPKTRRHLIPIVPASYVKQVIAIYMAQRSGTGPGTTVWAALPDEASPEHLAIELGGEELTTVAPEVLRRLGGRYAAFADTIEAQNATLNTLPPAAIAAPAAEASMEAHIRHARQAPTWQPRWEPPTADAQSLLDTMPLDKVPAISPPPNGSRIPFVPNPHFMGRDETLLALANALRGGERVAVALRAAATGLGGIGKTSLAAEFIHRYGTFFAGGVFWLSCADPAALASEVAACGGPGHLDLHPAFNDLKLDDQVQLVRAAWQQEIPRLLIFDACDDPHIIQQWAPVSGGCRILITSRRQAWPGDLGIHTLRLDVLSRQSSRDLLQMLVPRLTHDEANAIATELGDLPLALQLAGKYLQQFPRINVVTYLAELRSDVILAHPSLRGQHNDVSLPQHDRHVGRTFLVSYQRLDPSNPRDGGALKLIACAGCLAPGEPIPITLVLPAAHLSSQEKTSQMALQRLLELGLIMYEPDSIMLHRLIHAFVGAVVTNQDAVPMVERTLIEQAKAINAAGYPEAMLPLIPHLWWRVHQAHGRTDLRLAYLCANLGAYLCAVGTYNAAQPLYERALAIYEQVEGPTHPSTASMLNDLATLLQSSGAYEDARPLYERALAIQEGLLGANHPDTARSLNDLAGLLSATGDYVAARPLYERAVAIREGKLGATHPQTAMSLNNLAALLQATGDYAGARPLAERALAIHEATLGPEHPDTATSLNNLAYLLETIGDYATARPLYERAVAIREATLGAEHPDTATSLNNLAQLHQSIGDYAAAHPLVERALAIREATLGSEHPAIAQSLNNLAGLLSATGDYARARPLYERALAIQEAVLGPQHPNTAASLNNLAQLYQAIGDYAAAQPFYERALTIVMQTLGGDHPLTALSLHNLAVLLQATGDYAGAKSLYTRALAIREQALGVEHPATALSLNNLTTLLQSMGDTTDVSPLHEQEWADFRHPVPPDDVVFIDIRAGQTATFSPQGDYQFDWADRLNGKLGNQTVWRSICTDLYQLKHELNQKQHYQVVIRPINTRLAIGYVIGFTFGSHTPFTLWTTPSSSMQDRYWISRQEFIQHNPLTETRLPSDDTGDIVIEAAINNPTSPAVTRWLTAANISVRSRLCFTPPPTPIPYAIQSSGEALAMAQQIGAAIRRERQTCGPCIIHLFGALPIGLAVLIGTQLNIGGELRLYHYDNAAQHYIFAGPLIYET